MIRRKPVVLAVEQLVSEYMFGTAMAHSPAYLPNCDLLCYNQSFMGVLPRFDVKLQMRAKTTK